MNIAAHSSATPTIDDKEPVEPRCAIEAHLRAKDENRPYLLANAFADEARVTVESRTESMALPPVSRGREAIGDVLVREFARMFENVRTLCLSSPPSPAASTFCCGWIVGMSEKASRSVRVGCGRYDWAFDASGRAVHLAIRIDLMQRLPSGTLAGVMTWLDELPCP